MRESLRQYCRRMEIDWLLEEFNSERNAPITPDRVSYGSGQKLWWRCKQGHEWQASPSSRRNGSRCPYCAGLKPVPGETDLATLEPEVAASWHPTRNGALTPRDVRINSKRLIWWICEKGHEYTAFPKARVAGFGCPVCAKEREAQKERRLAEKFPQLAAQWDYKRNGALTPEDVSIDSSKKVWWICEAGHEWQTPVVARTTGNSPCPVCSGKKVVRGVNDLATVNPKLASQWAEENGPLKPEEVAAGSCKRVWWRCRKGHLYRASVAAQNEGKAHCPYCLGRMSWTGQLAAPERVSV